MAKTIEDMATGAFPYVEDEAIKQGRCKYMIELKVQRFAYFTGAYAVLEEIESCLGEFYSPDDYTNIKNKIKELRGYGKGLE